MLTTFTQICLGTLYVGIADNRVGPASAGMRRQLQLTSPAHVSIGDPDCCTLGACKGTNYSAMP